MLDSGEESSGQEDKSVRLEGHGGSGLPGLLSFPEMPGLRSGSPRSWGCASELWGEGGASPGPGSHRCCELTGSFSPPVGPGRPEKPGEPGRPESPGSCGSASCSAAGRWRKCWPRSGTAWGRRKYTSAWRFHISNFKLINDNCSKTYFWLKLNTSSFIFWENSILMSPTMRSGLGSSMLIRPSVLLTWYTSDTKGRTEVWRTSNWNKTWSTSCPIDERVKRKMCEWFFRFFLFGKWPLTNYVEPKEREIFLCFDLLSCVSCKFRI